MSRLIGWGIVLILGVVAAAACLVTSAVSIRPGEVVVVRRFGRALPAPWLPGLHWGLPLGLEQRDRVRLDEVRRLDVGLSGVAGPADEPGAGEFLAGDRNLAQVRAVVQYRVAEPGAFVLAAADPEAVLLRLAEAGLARSLSKRGINAILRDDRAAIAREARDELDRAARRAGLGVAILGVSLTDVRPPVEVQPAFDDAQAARSEQARRAHEAQAQAETTVAAAKAEADAVLDRAAARAERTVQMAGSRRDRFLALLDQARTDPALTVRRIYHDALRDLLPRVGRKVVLTGDEPLDLSLFGRAVSE